MKRYLIKLCGGIAIIAIALVLLWASWQSEAFATWYAVHIYPVFPATIGRFTGMLPFSVFEIGLILISLSIVVWIVRTVVQLFSVRGRKKLMPRLKRLPLILIYFAGTVLLVFVLTAGINYSRRSFADHLGLAVTPSPIEELEALFFRLNDRAHSMVPYITTDAEGHFVLSDPNTYQIAIQSMKDLNTSMGDLNTFFPRATTLPFLNFILSHARITGFFSPWTLEAHYNRAMPYQNVPFVINHELAHVAGHMREDEANFIAYLSARDSGHIDFEYSAVYIGLGYVLNALVRVVSTARYAELFNMLPEQVIRDLANARAFWQQFDGPVAEVQRQVNDAYLRINRVPDGVLSYGRIVDWMLAYYRNAP